MIEWYMAECPICKQKTRVKKSGKVGWSPLSLCEHYEETIVRDTGEVIIVFCQKSVAVKEGIFDD